jgi:hypothetical protein
MTSPIRKAVQGKRVWVVEQGEYSDYRVVGVFSSQANAQQIADAINASRGSSYSATVDEWPLDPAVEELSQGRHQYNVTMRKDGTVERCVRSEEVSGYDIAGSISMWRRTQASAYRNYKDVQDAMTATVWATDDTHAIKIVNEHRAQYIASGEWETA